MWKSKWKRHAGCNVIVVAHNREARIKHMLTWHPERSMKILGLKEVPSLAEVMAL